MKGFASDVGGDESYLTSAIESALLSDRRPPGSSVTALDHATPVTLNAVKGSYGPVRTVKSELAFERILPSDKKTGEADTLIMLRSMMDDHE